MPKRKAADENTIVPQPNLETVTTESPTLALLPWCDGFGIYPRMDAWEEVRRKYGFPIVAPVSDRFEY